MRRLLLVGLSFLCMGANVGRADEVTLYNSSGTPVAYIDTGDDSTIYLWSGMSVAYLDKSAGETNIWGFNGKHLGWFENGVIWDNRGDGACAIEAALPNFGRPEPLRSLKRLKPLKQQQELTPLKPIISRRFGKIRCATLLNSGLARLLRSNGSRGKVLQLNPATRDRRISGGHKSQ
jgi:4-fold beta-flower domain-containing protein